MSAFGLSNNNKDDGVYSLLAAYIGGPVAQATWLGPTVAATWHHAVFIV